MYPQWFAISSVLSGSLSFQVAVAEHSMPSLFKGGPYLRKYGMSLEFLTVGGELLWGNCTVFPVTVQGILTGGT